MTDPKNPTEDLPLALARLAEARAERDRAMETYNAQEAEHGVGSPEAERFAAETIDPLHGAVFAREREAGEAPAGTMRDALAKVAALAHEGMEEEAFAHLRADAERFLGLAGATAGPRRDDAQRGRSMGAAAGARSYELGAMLRTCVLALDALDGCDRAADAGSLRITLEVAERLAAELIDAVEDLERLAKVGPIYGPKDAA